MRKLLKVARVFRQKLGDYATEELMEEFQDPEKEKPMREAPYRRMEETPAGPEPTTSLTPDEAQWLIHALMQFKHELPYSAKRKHREKFERLRKKLYEMT